MKLEDSSTVEETLSYDGSRDANLTSFQGAVAQFKFSPSPSTPRRSPRNRVLRGVEDDSLPTSRKASAKSPLKRQAVSDDEKILTRSPKKLKRGYAAPEMYAHLHVLQDHLKEELDGNLFDYEHSFGFSNPLKLYQ